jgi:hypothetical protein
MTREGSPGAGAQRLARWTMPLALLAVLLWPALGACAETFPSRPIRIVVGQTPGNAPDTLARMVAERLSVLLQTPVAVENRSGASGTIAADLVARAPADGYTLLMGGLSNLITAGLLQAGVPYDSVRDFAPIGRVAYTPFVLVATTSLPVTNIPELLAYARSRPGSVTLGTYGEGSLGRLIYEMLRATTGVELLQVPYKGVGAAVADVIARSQSERLRECEPTRKDRSPAHPRRGRLAPCAWRRQCADRRGTRRCRLRDRRVVWVVGAGGHAAGCHRQACRSARQDAPRAGVSPAPRRTASHSNRRYAGGIRCGDSIRFREVHGHGAACAARQVAARRRYRLDRFLLAWRRTLPRDEAPFPTTLRDESDKLVMRR